MVRVGLPVLLLASALAAAAMPTATAQSLTCPTVPENTLTFACGSVCSASRACVNSGSRSSASGASCSCLNITGMAPDGKASRMYLLIPFGTYKSEEEKAAQATQSEKLLGKTDTSTYAYASNNVLTRVSALSLPSGVTGVVIRGGSSMEAVTKHQVANVTFDPRFLVSATKQVTYLELENLAIGDAIDKMISNLPLATVQLQLRNNLIKKFPADLDRLGALRYLHVSFNDIETISKANKLNDLTSLYLRNNKLKTFEALFPKLETLDLMYNYFDGVPEIVPKHTNLKKLQLGGSANTILKFDESHAIKGLEQLWLFDTNLETFDATLPNLIELELSDNNLKEIPPKVFKMSKLEKLGLTTNKKMLNVSLTNVQANFIYNLKEFKIDNKSLRTDCDAAQKYTFTKLNVTMCLSEPKDLTVIEGVRVIPPDATPASGSGAGSANVVAPTEESSSSNLPVIIGSIAGVLVAAGIIAAFVIKKRKDKQAKAADALTGMTGTVTGTTMTGTNGTSLWIDADLLSLKVSSDDIEDIKKIGNGAFADVWLVKFRGSELMASKRLRESGVSRPQIQNFIDEIKLVATLKHPCIVELKGVAWVRESDLQALFEYMDSGDLRDHLVNSQVQVKWSAEKLQIAIDIAEALVYVHSFMPPLVHRDLKSRNVLLNSAEGEATMRAKLTDFGVSRFRSEDNTMTSGVGTGRWLAPEVISGDGDYSSPADIFSFGALLFELDTHKLPYDDVRGPNGNRLADVALLQLVSTGELTPTLSASCPEKITELANRCFALRPADRPTAAEVAYALRTLRKTLVF